MPNIILFYQVRMDTIIKIDLEKKLSSGDKIYIELGCGPNKRIPDAIGVDCLDLKGVDIVANLDLGLPFLPDQSVDDIYSYHFLEHLSQFDFMMKEVYRVLKPGGAFRGVVPYFSNPYYYGDPTHHTPFSIYTFYYYSKDQTYFKRQVPSFYNDIDFKIDHIQLNFRSNFKKRSIIKRWVQKIVNRNNYRKEFYEELLSYTLPAYEIDFQIRKQ